MAAGTNHVISETGIGAVRLEMMAEGTVRPESGARIEPRVGIYMRRVGKIEHDGPLVLVARKGQQILAAGRREHRVALRADLLLHVLIEVVLRPRRTLIVPGAA